MGIGTGVLGKGSWWGGVPTWWIDGMGWCSCPPGFDFSLPNCPGGGSQNCPCFPHTTGDVCDENDDYCPNRDCFYNGPGGDIISDPFCDPYKYSTTPSIGRYVYAGQTGATLDNIITSSLNDSTWEFIPGLTTTWCPLYEETEIWIPSCYSWFTHSVKSPVSIKNFNDTINNRQVVHNFGSLSVPQNQIPENGARYLKPINGLSNNGQEWYTSISSISKLSNSDVYAVGGHQSHSSAGGVYKNGSTEPFGYLSQITQGITYFAQWDPRGSTLSSQIILTDKFTSTEYPTQYIEFPLSVFNTPYYIDGNEAKNTPQISVPGVQINNCDETYLPWSFIGAGDKHSFAIDSSDQVYGWGRNDSDQVTIPSTLGPCSMIRGGIDTSIALKTTGEVVLMGSDIFYNIPGNMTTCLEVDSGDSGGGAAFYIVLKSDNSVAAWGSNTFLQINVPSELTSPGSCLSVRAGKEFCVALKTNGSLVAWGRSNLSQLNVPTTGIYTHIEAGHNHGLALKNDNSVVAWGHNNFNQNIVPMGLGQCKKIAAGGNTSAAIKLDGTLVLWGSDAHNQINSMPTDLGPCIDVVIGHGHVIAIKEDGSLVAWGGTQVGSNYGQGTIPFNPGPCTCNQNVSSCIEEDCDLCRQLVCASIGTGCPTEEWSTSCVEYAAFLWANETTPPFSFTFRGVNYGTNIGETDTIPIHTVCATHGPTYPGTTAEGDVFATLWDGVRTNQYKSFGFDYFSIKDNVPLANYRDYDNGVFGNRPDLLLFRLANSIYPDNFMVGYTGCNLAQNGGMSGQTSCIDHLYNPFGWIPAHSHDLPPDTLRLTCDMDNYMWTSAFYDKISVGSRHALVTLGSYERVWDTPHLAQPKKIPYLIQFSGQTFGKIDKNKTSWSTLHIDLPTTGNWSESPILGTFAEDSLRIVNGISYGQDKDKLYEFGITAEVNDVIQEVRIFDVDNNVCSFKDGNVILENMCDLNLSIGFTSCFKTETPFGSADHPIWNRGYENMPNISIISAKKLCEYMYSLTDTVDGGNWEWISAGNTGESCAVCSCELRNEPTSVRNFFCWGNRFDEQTISQDIWPTGGPTDGVDGGGFVVSEHFMPSWAGISFSKGTTSDVAYSPCQIDIKGSSPVFYYKSKPFAAIKGHSTGQNWFTYTDTNGIEQTLPYTQNIHHSLGKTKYRNTSWKTEDSFGDSLLHHDYETALYGSLDENHLEPQSSGVHRHKIYTPGSTTTFNPTVVFVYNPNITYRNLFTPTYPLISTNAWLNNRYKNYTSPGCIGGTGSCCKENSTTGQMVCSDNGGEGVDEGDCIAGLGIFKAAPTACSTNPCANILGICCDPTDPAFPEGKCEEGIFNSNCQLPKIWESVSTCLASTCFQTGACCGVVGQNGTCESNIKEMMCRDTTEIFENGVNCSVADCFKTGACCPSSGGCGNKTQWFCDQVSSNEFTVGHLCGAPDSCAPTTEGTGVCCISGVCYDDVDLNTAFPCGLAGGHFISTTTVCTTSPSPCSGSCCDDGECTETTNCHTAQFEYGKTCTPNPCSSGGSDCCEVFVGPCCYPELGPDNRPVCDEGVSPSACISGGGIFLGFNKTCNDCGLPGFTKH